MSSPTFVPIQREHFDEGKATQSAAWFLNNLPNEMSAAKLMSLLYLADREALSRFGYAITTDQYEIVDGLPVLRNIQARLDGTLGIGFWSSHIIINNYAKLAVDPGGGRLSKGIRSIFRTVLNEYGSLPETVLFDRLRKLPECSLSDHTPVDYRRILRAAGKSQAEIDVVADRVDSINSMEALLDQRENL